MNQVFLTKKQVIELIKEYFHKHGDKDVEVNIILELSSNTSGIGTYEKTEDDIIITFEVTKTEEINNTIIKTICNLQLEDLNEIFKSYEHQEGFEYDSFLYVGGIRHVGYFVDEDTPIFEGILLNYREKSLKKKLKMF